ncbi:thiamine pyrophosphate-binding protein [Kineococcus gynurae]|uniref:Thiamine pyrophosphate-binding protein n=1 Tax=Kineococcus gynurae TaxID=452979 RepID=A0ABV5LTA9_9ACTN
MQRNGGDLVVETLTALGARTVFGIPGQHALGLFDALRRSDLEFVSSRVENNAAFAADGWSRVTGSPSVLFLSTGPGALTALAGLAEAAATAVPVVVVVSQIPRAGLGGRRRGHLHQLDEQSRAAADVTKSRRTVLQPSAVPSALTAAWAEATTAPQGPVWVEIPQDVLLEPTAVPTVRDVRADPSPSPARAELLDAAADLLAGARRPAILAGGGVRRAGAEAELLAVAEAVRAPVVTSPGGKGAFPFAHELSLQSWIEDVAVTELLADADVLLVVGTSMGEVTSNYFTLRPRGRIVQVDAEARVLESNHPALGIAADAGEALAGLRERLTARAPDGDAEARVATTLATVAARLDAQDLATERAVLQGIRDGVPDDAATFWDMTVAGYWAWSAWDPRSGAFHSAQGAGGIGWAYGAALGGAAAGRGRVLAVSGDGGAMYSIAELAVARQHDLPVTWLIVDDGGYGVLRDYMRAAFGEATHTELARPDFPALAAAFGVPAELTDVAGLAGALARAWRQEGPNVVVLPQHLDLFAPTHLGG